MWSLPTVTVNKPIINKPNNECGNCTACCHVFQIEEIAKPERTPCQYLFPKGSGKCGCSIHDNYEIDGGKTNLNSRVSYPQDCKSFRCIWLDGHLQDGKLSYRPDKLGLVLMVMENVPFSGMIGVFRVNQYAPLSAKATKLLKAMEEKHLFFYETKVIGPEHLVKKWVKQWTKS